MYVGTTAMVGVVSGKIGTENSKVSEHDGRDVEMLD
jgi:hypothetical protein